MTIFQVVTENNIVLVESPNEASIASWALDNCYRDRAGWTYVPTGERIYRVIKNK